MSGKKPPEDYNDRRKWIPVVLNLLADYGLSNLIEEFRQLRIDLDDLLKNETLLKKILGQNQNDDLLFDFRNELIKRLKGMGHNLQESNNQNDLSRKNELWYKPLQTISKSIFGDRPNKPQDKTEDQNYRGVIWKASPAYIDINDPVPTIAIAVYNTPYGQPISIHFTRGPQTAIEDGYNPLSEGELTFGWTINTPPNCEGIYGLSHSHPPSNQTYTSSVLVVFDSGANNSDIQQYSNFCFQQGENLSFLPGYTDEVDKYRDKKGRTFLMLFIISGKIDSITKILNFPSLDLNLKCHFGFTALHYAAIYGKLEVVKLLENRINFLKEKGPNGLNALHLSIEHNKHNVTEYLMNKYPLLLLDSDDDHQTPIHAAAILKSLKTIIHFRKGKMLSLKDKKKILNQFDAFTHTPLNWCLLNKNEAMGIELLELKHLIQETIEDAQNICPEDTKKKLGNLFSGLEISPPLMPSQTEESNECQPIGNLDFSKSISSISPPFDLSLSLPVIVNQIQDLQILNSPIQNVTSNYLENVNLDNSQELYNILKTRIEQTSTKASKNDDQKLLAAIQKKLKSSTVDPNESS